MSDQKSPCFYDPLPRRVFIEKNRRIILILLKSGALPSKDVQRLAREQDEAALCQSWRETFGQP